ncbi:MAG: TlpA family protein disulfide reductase [Alistipes sp.]|nr:TlpA family protein disulfide reductase [Alistipes sp.]
MAIQTRKKRKSGFQMWLMLALIVVIMVVLVLPMGGGDNSNEAAEPVVMEESERDDLEATTLVKAGMPAPDFTVTMFDGRQVTLSSLRGSVVLVNFWATWCPPCREELARVQSDLIDRFRGREFIFLPISRGETREAVAAFREQMSYTFAMGLDPERAIYDLYASNYIPRNFLIDREGTVVLASVGYEPEEFDALLVAIESTLNNK